MTFLPKAALAAAAAGALALGAMAAPASAASNRDCFYSNQWTGWRAPADNVLYLRVGVKDVYRVDLSVGSSRLKWGDSHLVNVVRGPNSICSALDLNLAVSDSNGFQSPLIARSIVKLSPDEIAAIPRKYRP